MASRIKSDEFQYVSEVLEINVDQLGKNLMISEALDKRISALEQAKQLGVPKKDDNLGAGIFATVIGGGLGYCIYNLAPSPWVWVARCVSFCWLTVGLGLLGKGGSDSTNSNKNIDSELSNLKEEQGRVKADTEKVRGEQHRLGAEQQRIEVERQSARKRELEREQEHLSNLNRSAQKLMREDTSLRDQGITPMIGILGTYIGPIIGAACGGPVGFAIGSLPLLAFYSWGARIDDKLKEVGKEIKGVEAQQSTSTARLNSLKV